MTDHDKDATSGGAGAGGAGGAGQAGQAGQGPEVRPEAGDFSAFFERLSRSGLDLKALFELGGKGGADLSGETARELQEGLESLARHRDEILRDSLEQWRRGLEGDSGRAAGAGGFPWSPSSLERALTESSQASRAQIAATASAWESLQQRFDESVVRLNDLLRASTDGQSGRGDRGDA